MLDSVHYDGLQKNIRFLMWSIRYLPYSHTSCTKNIQLELLIPLRKKDRFPLLSKCLLLLSCFHLSCDNRMWYKYIYLLSKNWNFIA